MISKELIKSCLKYLDCYLPVYKPAGISTNAIREGIKLDGYYVLERSGIQLQMFCVDTVRSLDPFADGVLTFSIGTKAKKRRNFMLAQNVYRGTIEFGARREFDCIDGKMLVTSNCDHIDAKIIEQTFAQFLGTTSQERSMSYQVRLGNEPSETSADYYNRIKLPDRECLTGPKPKQKYSYVPPSRNMEIRFFKLLSYSKPFAEFRISCNGSCSVRQVCRDVSQKLNVDASLVRLTRVAEGPLNIEDLRILQLHELTLDYYASRLSALAGDYSKFNADMDEKLEDFQT